MTWNNVQPPCNTCVHCAQSSQYHGNHLGSTLAYLHPQVAILGQLLSMLPIDVAIGRTADVNEKAGVSLPVSETDVRSVGFDLPCSGDGRIPHHYDVIRRHCTTACHNVVDCFQACTAHAASGTDISMQDVVLVVPSPKSLVLSSHHQSLSRTRKVRSLQPTKGLFRINRRLLSETAILTVHRFPAP